MQSTINAKYVSISSRCQGFNEFQAITLASLVSSRINFSVKNTKRLYDFDWPQHHTFTSVCKCVMPTKTFPSSFLKYSVVWRMHTFVKYLRCGPEDKSYIPGHDAGSFQIGQSVEFMPALCNGLKKPKTFMLVASKWWIFWTSHHSV